MGIIIETKCGIVTVILGQRIFFIIFLLKKHTAHGQQHGGEEQGEQS